MRHILVTDNRLDKNGLMHGAIARDGYIAGPRYVLGRDWRADGTAPSGERAYQIRGHVLPTICAQKVASERGKKKTVTTEHDPILTLGEWEPQFSTYFDHVSGEHDLTRLEANPHRLA